MAEAATPAAEAVALAGLVPENGPEQEPEPEQGQPVAELEPVAVNEAAEPPALHVGQAPEAEATEEVAAEEKAEPQ